MVLVSTINARWRVTEYDLLLSSCILGQHQGNPPKQHFLELRVRPPRNYLWMHHANFIILPDLFSSEQLRKGLLKIMFPIIFKIHMLTTDTCTTILIITCHTKHTTIQCLTLLEYSLHWLSTENFAQDRISALLVVWSQFQFVEWHANAVKCIHKNQLHSKYVQTPSNK